MLKEKNSQNQVNEVTKHYDAVALYSGGTDSSVAPILASKTIGKNILLLMIDLGCTPESIEQAEKRAEILGMDFVVINGVKEFSDRFLSESIKMNGSYFGYPLGTPLGRAFMMELALKFLKTNSHLNRYVIHGCNASQNTRFRIEKLCKFENNVLPIGPLVQKNYSREEKCNILLEHGIPVSKGDNYAQDENIFCRALEGDIFNDLTDVNSLGVYNITVDPLVAPDKPEEISFEFKNGVPVSINGVQKPMDEIIIDCRSLGAKHGIGRIVSLEDTIPELGYKERGVYESPASVILYTAHKYIEDIVYNKIERQVKRQLDEKWADVVYRGDWFGSERVQISDFCSRFNEKVNGQITLRLYKGNVYILNANINSSLLLTGEESKGAY